MDEEAMYRAGRARQGGMPAPKGGGYGNGGRVAKAGYARGGMVEGGPGHAEPAAAAHSMRKVASQKAGRPVALKGGGRVKGC